MQSPIDVLNDQESAIVKVFLVLVYLFFLPLVVLWFVVSLVTGGE